MNRLHRSLFFSAADRYGSLAFQLLSVAILSRLLTPKEFGIYSVVMALMLLAQTLREFGGANYLIQKPSLSEHCIRTAFTVTFAISCSVAGLLFALRGAAAWFFAEGGLRDGIAILALNFLLLPASVTISALLRREMAFDVIALCDLGANFVTAITSVALAAMGFGFMGPVWGSVAGNTAMVLLFLACRRDMRIFRPCLRSWRDVVGFGTYSSATVIINVLYQYSPQLILGRVLGFTAVGLYGRAINVTQVFDKVVLDVLNPVIMPAISAQARTGANLKDTYLNAIELITALHWPFLLFLALMADPIVAILFGSQWVEVVPLVRMLALASLSLFAACLTYPVLVAVGRVRDTLTASLISVPPSLFAIFIASLFGIEAVAAIALITLPLQAVVALCFIRRQIAFQPAELVRATRKSALVAACTTMGIVPVVGANSFDLAISQLGFFAAACGASAGWCLGLLITRHPLVAELHSAARRVLLIFREFSSLRRRTRIAEI